MVKYLIIIIVSFQLISCRSNLKAPNVIEAPFSMNVILSRDSTFTNDTVSIWVEFENFSDTFIPYIPESNLSLSILNPDLFIPFGYLKKYNHIISNVLESDTNGFIFRPRERIRKQFIIQIDTSLFNVGINKIHTRYNSTINVNKKKSKRGKTYYNIKAPDVYLYVASEAPNSR
ncbi:hypothetical protein AEM51_08405 [Bacteroidetes bacterium UKL13-3]|nr:hypothetical protein AEM51_08405 [Bacteroidetes bacterium UKL13-3]HCP94168.1 hypothetical protein [Bacteroidota bacterium]